MLSTEVSVTLPRPEQYQRQHRKNRQRNSMSNARDSPYQLSSDPTSLTWRSHARSVSSVSSSSSLAPIRLADLAKQHGMGIHVDNWREDMTPVRQHLPMQHIIGSLKRDRDEPTTWKAFDNVSSWNDMRFPSRKEASAASPMSEDSFLHMLRTPKRRRLSASSRTDSQYTTDSDPDRRFSYQAAEHIAKDIPQSALPGLNHVLNLSTITAEERDIFSEYAPKRLEDPQVLMDEVLQLREQMMDEEIYDAASMDSGIIPLERDAEVQKALEEFIDMNPNRRYIAKI